MYGNAYQHLGEMMEEEAISLLKQRGFKLIFRGGHQTPYDAIMEKNGSKFAINIKFGKKFTESKENIAGLFSLDCKPAIFYLTREGKCYFMEIEAL